jgi:cyclopropane-fatty-acyl-phospholipid synthase
VKFIMAEIFPGGDLPQPKDVSGHAEHAGFEVTRVQSLRMHYARTLDCWSAALEANRERAVEIQSQEVYDRYLRYLTGCAELFRDGYIDVCQFTLAKAAD